MRPALRCPVCGENSNTSGRPFYSEWAIASHVAGKIVFSSYDTDHESWACKMLPNLDCTLSVPKLADELIDIIRIAVKIKNEPPPSKTSHPSPLSLVHEIEIVLHQHVRSRLQERFGTDNDAWWVKGVPLPIREECAMHREADPSRSDPFSYTYLINLSSIMGKNWRLFEDDFLRVKRSCNSKKDFLEQFGRLNEIRNSYAHPVRSPQIGSDNYNDDFSFVKQMADLLSKFTGVEISVDEQ